MNTYRNCPIEFWDMHDGKMLYLLIQNSSYNRKFYPFLFCKCRRGDFLKDGFKCELITHNEHQILYDNSSRKFGRNLEKNQTKYGSDKLS